MLVGEREREREKEREREREREKEMRNELIIQELINKLTTYLVLITNSELSPLALHVVTTRFNSTQIDHLSMKFKQDMAGLVKVRLL